ncbi:MAG TPA: DUF6600 domain-containing protein [Bryobacteraceae bacterium]|nr:DUF6600 domain-containing protein [Bryobacteraceae bacterium]
MNSTLLRTLASIAFALPLALADEASERGVARISLIEGEVSVRRGDADEIVAAAINAPLVAGDYLYTGQGSRAELQFDYSNMMRLAANTEVRLAELEFRRYLIQLAEGNVVYRVLRDQEAEVEISTPGASIRPVRRGTYRISVLSDGSAEITVRSGEAEIFSPKGSERLTAGHTMYTRLTPDGTEVRVASAIPLDDFDRWNEQRDRDLERSRAYQYISRDIYGAEDLDAYGNWIYDGPYGWVWSPTVAAGWAPYRNGRWSWIDYYGWNWVSYDPWGWAPYHFGRWYHRPNRGWCWYPGGFGVRHYWSPALVAFFGFGRGAAGFQNIGWLPLAPRDPFHRWWGRGIYGGYRDRGLLDSSIYINRSVNVTNLYRNASVDNAISGISTAEFGRGAGHSRLGVDDILGASALHGALPLAPGRESLRWVDRAPVEVRPASPTLNERFYSRRQPSSNDRVPFDVQRQGLEEVSRRTFTAAPGSDGAMAGGSARKPADSLFDRGGWRGFGNPNVSREPSENRHSSGTGLAPDDSGWRRFGYDRSSGRSKTPAASGDNRRNENQAIEGVNDDSRLERSRGWRRDLEATDSNSDNPGPARSGWSGFGRGDSIRVNPPIVRDRNDGWIGRGRSGGDHPHSMDRSAPRSEGRGTAGREGAGISGGRSQSRGSDGGDGGGRGGGRNRD